MSLKDLSELNVEEKKKDIARNASISIGYSIQHGKFTKAFFRLFLAYAQMKLLKEEDNGLPNGY